LNALKNGLLYCTTFFLEFGFFLRIINFIIITSGSHATTAIEWLIKEKSELGGVTYEQTKKPSEGSTLYHTKNGRLELCFLNPP